MKPFHLYHLAAITLLTLAFSSFVFSQEPPIIWGEIPRADLEMKSYPLDTNASAVILCDYGESYITEQYRNIYKRHLRVKILTPKGYSFGTHSFVLFKNWREERARDVEGTTYFLNEHGDVIKNQLLEKDILIKDIDSRRKQYWLTLPALRPGCVIELHYTIFSKDILFKDWVFQRNEPVRRSEYRILFPREIGFSAIHQGSLPFAVHENNSVIEKVLYSTTRECTKMRWAVVDAPALREEPFMTSINDYVKKVSVQISGFAIPGFKIGDVLQDWDAFRKELFEDEDFGKRADPPSAIQELAEKITQGISSPQEKAKAIYSWVSKSIVWSNYNTFFAWQDFDDVVSSKKGNSADINFLLLSLLKTSGVNGDPVILSTRSNGKFKESYPVISQFDYMLVRASIDSQYYFLDATDPDRPFDLLPAKVLNMTGLVITEDALEWIKLSSSKRLINISAANLVLKKDGSISGTLEDMYRDYGGLEIRDSLNKKKDIDIAKKLFDTDTREITIDSLSIEAKDSIDLPFKIKAHISSATYAQSNGDLIYFNPHILHRLTENPLKSEKRNFPLDYAYQREHTAIVNLTIPDSFEVHESVVSRNLIVGSNLALFSRKVFIKGSQLRIHYKWEIRETEIDTAYYARMRDFYTQIIAIESEQFVFARIKQPVSSFPTVAPNTSTPKKESRAPLKKGKK